MWRTYLKHLVIHLTVTSGFWAASVTTPVADKVTGQRETFAYRARDLSALRAGFPQPPSDARPWVHWFWWSNVLSREEIARELQEMAEAGFGTAEIRIATANGWPPSRALPWMDPASLERIGHRKFEYLSPTWVEMLEFTCATAERLGLRLAINLGQGWPPGGPWITDEHRSRLLVWQSEEIEGGHTIERAELPDNTTVVAWRMAEAGKNVEPSSYRELGRYVRSRAGERTLHWAAPAGRWLVGIFTVLPGGLCDKGEGPEADPASREATLFHLEHMFSRLDPRIGRFYGTTLIDAASDSWEYEPPRSGQTGRNWSRTIPGAFARLAGYELQPRWHALLGYGPDAERVRHDLEDVERRLVRDNCLEIITKFLNARGLGYRAQLYGRGLHRDLLEAYLTVDTPEVEQGVYCVPEAIWVARTTGKPIVSAESFTHLSMKMGTVRRPHGEWETNPAHLRGAANELFAQGVNRIQLHSFSYSPPGLPYPGWRMYAEIHLNRNSPWWHHIRPLTAWLARNHWVQQAGCPVADALVYPIASDPPDGPFRLQSDRQPVSALNAVDGANRFTLPLIQAARAAGNYEVNDIVLTAAPTVVSEVENLLSLIEAGVVLHCAQSRPDTWPVLQGNAAVELRRRIDSLVAAGRVREARSGGWRAALDSVRSVRWSPSKSDLNYHRRRVAGAELYFVANLGDDFNGEISFAHSGKSVEIWNADTGSISPAAQYAERDGRTHLRLALRHAESALVTFSAKDANPPVRVVKADGGSFDVTDEGKLQGRFDRAGRYEVTLSTGITRVIEVALPPPFELSGPWTLSVSAAQALSPQNPVTLKLERLVSWRQLPELRRYAGSATYGTEFELPTEMFRPDFGLTLDLGEVYELARVELNGYKVGTAWYPPHRLDVTAALRPGRNTLRLEVPNQMKNNFERTDGYSRPISAYGGKLAASSAGGDFYTRPSGLLGPVRLIPEHRVDIGSVESQSAQR